MNGADDSRKLTRRSLFLASLLVPGLKFARLACGNFEIANASDSAPAGALDYKAKPIPFTQVDVTDGFWAPRMEVNRSVSIWHCFDREKDHRESFGNPRLIEAAAYMIAKRPDPKLEAYCDKIIDDMVAALTPRLSDPEKAVRVPGHFLEGAVAYYAVTGKRKMLDCALLDANAIDAAFGPGRKTYISEHEGQKIGLLALYRQTGDDRYWKLAKFFLDERGKDNYPRTGEYLRDRTYAQDHERVIQQDAAVGHCVRATYLYIPLTDIAALTGDTRYASADDKIWEDAVFHKTYLTGGIGSIRFHEQYGAPFELPNLSAWNETCASYGNIVWNQRMFLLHRDARYVDVMERILYNGFADGVSLKGDRFFYQNPLKSFGDYERFDWINVPCCPPNVVRLTASIGSYIYAQSADAIYVNLFVGSTTKIELPDQNAVTIRQETRYPWDGAVKIHVEPDRPASFALQVRVPGWARNQVMPGDLYQYAERNSEPPQILVNGRRTSLEGNEGILQANGYARLERRWNKGDEVELRLPIPVRRVYANPQAIEDREMVALERGPIVYCAEWPDNDGHALNLVIPDDAKFESDWRGDFLGGVQVVKGSVQAIARASDGKRVETHAHPLVAIPYHAWSNRGMGEMAVWMPRTHEKAWIQPVPPAPIARVDSSGGVAKKWTGYNDQNSDIGAIYHGKDPIHSADESYRYFKMRPPVGERAWVEYEFATPTKISSSKVYWFDDRRFCRLPESWRVLYRDSGEWTPVKTAATYAVTKDEFNAVEFEPVATTAVRIEVEPSTKSYKKDDIGPPDAMFIDADIEWREFGILEWRVS
jgi:DUF1680 family protein